MFARINLPQQVWKFFGFIFVGLGVIGIVLPMMPGLVFFILASFCFARSSPKFLRKIIAHPVIGPQIMDWKRGKGMRMKTKVLAIMMVTVSLTFSAFFLVKPEYVKWIILVSMLGINGYILSVKTRKPEPSIVPLPKIQQHDRQKSTQNSKTILDAAEINPAKRK